MRCNVTLFSYCVDITHMACSVVQKNTSIDRKEEDDAILATSWAAAGVQISVPSAVQLNWLCFTC
jgi:hypothetical protein